MFLIDYLFFKSNPWLHPNKTYGDLRQFLTEYVDTEG